MKKKFAFSAVLGFLLAVNSAAQEIVTGKVVLERRNVTATRQIELWMMNPTKNPRSADDELYTCPDQTRGHFYAGVAQVSLIDTKTRRVINTVEIEGNGISSDGNVLDLPYKIKRGYYRVPRIDKNKEGKPVLLDFKDYNRDGLAQEFALFDAVACMGLPSTLIGYSAKQDKVLQYVTELKTDEATEKRFWIDYFFGQKADRKGVWRYEIDYRGRGGALEKYELRYDRQKEIFYGTRRSIFEDGERPSK